MLIYFLILICIPMMFFLFKNKKVYLMLSLFILFLISTFRAFNMGADYHSYIGYFYSIGNGAEIVEVGYRALNKIVYYFSQSPILLTFAVNLIIFIILYKVLDKEVNKKYLWLSMFIFVANIYLYIQSTFNMLRQGCAMLIVLLAITYLCKKSILKYLICILIASTFHTSALIFLILIPIRYINFKAVYFVILGIITFFINLFFNANIIISLFANFLDYTGYLNDTMSIFNFKIYVIFILGLLLFYCINYKKLYINEREKFYIDIYLLGLAILPILVKADATYRIYVYFSYISLISIPILIQNLKKPLIRWGYIGYFSLMYIAFFIKCHADNNIKYIPFKFVDFTDILNIF